MLKKKLQVALLRGKNSILTLYFDENLAIKTDHGNLIKLIEDSYTFLVYDLYDIIEAYSGEKIVGKRATQLRKSNVDFKELLSKQKVNMLSIMNKFDRYLVEWLIVPFYLFPMRCALNNKTDLSGYSGLFNEVQKVFKIKNWNSI